MDADYRVMSSSEPEASVVLHISTTDAWEAAQEAGRLVTDSLATEGFIHCCTPEQLPGVLDRFYGGRDDVMVLVVDGHHEQVASSLRWEAPAHPDGTPNTDAEMSLRFPHVYGAIPVEALRPWERSAG